MLGPHTFSARRLCECFKSCPSFDFTACLVDELVTTKKIAKISEQLSDSLSRSINLYLAVQLFLEYYEKFSASSFVNRALIIFVAQAKVGVRSP
jgi:hypothetical protein